jgi:hypothetical protein
VYNGMEGYFTCAAAFIGARLRRVIRHGIHCRQYRHPG